MKEFSGGDKIQAREMYKAPFEFKPQFKMALLCNDLPAVPWDDEGSWRRIRRVDFIAKFTHKPQKIYEFPIDPYLSRKLEQWKEAFMYLLIEYFKKYKANGIHEPPEVTEATKQYQRMADMYTDFLDATICQGNEHDNIKIEELYFKYRSWYTQNYSGSSENLKQFRDYLCKKLGTYSPVRGWIGLRFRRHRVEGEDPDDYEEEITADYADIKRKNDSGGRSGFDKPIEETEAVMEEQSEENNNQETENNQEMENEVAIEESIPVEEINISEVEVINNQPIENFKIQEDKFEEEKNILIEEPKNNNLEQKPKKVLKIDTQKRTKLKLKTRLKD